MSLTVPSTQSISDNVVAQIQSSIGQTIPLLPKTFTRVLAKVLAGVVVILYKYGGFIFLQLFVSTASMAETTINGKKIKPLVEWGRLIGVGDPYAATRAELVINVSVTNQVGNLPAGSQLLRTSTGFVYQTTTVRALNAATVQVTVRATSDQNDGQGLGSTGNLQVGDELQFANPVPNISQKATVSSVAVTAADAETEGAYRARVLDRFRKRPQGGAGADYDEWALGVPGIVAVYPYAGQPGQVVVYVEATPASSGSPDGIPTAAQLSAVLDAINLDESGIAKRRPLNAAPNVVPIVRQVVDVTISGFQADDPTAVKADIHAALDEYLRSREPFIVGLSVLPRQDRITVAALGGIVDSVVNAAEKATVTTVSFSLGGIGQTAITLGQGEKAKLGVDSYP